MSNICSNVYIENTAELTKCIANALLQYRKKMEQYIVMSSDDSLELDLIREFQSGAVLVDKICKQNGGIVLIMEREKKI